MKCDVPDFMLLACLVILKAKLWKILSMKIQLPLIERTYNMPITTFVINLDDDVAAYLKVKNVININAYTIWLLKKEHERLNQPQETSPQVCGII